MTAPPVIVVTTNSIGGNMGYNVKFTPWESCPSAGISCTGHPDSTIHVQVIWGRLRRDFICDKCFGIVSSESRQRAEEKKGMEGGNE